MRALARAGIDATIGVASHAPQPVKFAWDGETHEGLRQLRDESPDGPLLHA